MVKRVCFGKSDSKETFSFHSISVSFLKKFYCKIMLTFLNSVFKF